MTVVIVALCLLALMITLDDMGEGRATLCFWGSIQTWGCDLCSVWQGRRTQLVISDAPDCRSAPSLLRKERSCFVVRFPGLLAVVCGVTWHYRAMGWTLEIPYCFC